MTYRGALILFDWMWPEHKASVRHTFDLLRAETGYPDIRDCFVQAVESEANLIEREMLREQPTEGRG